MCLAQCSLLRHCCIVGDPWPQQPPRQLVCLRQSTIYCTAYGDKATGYWLLPFSGMPGHFARRCPDQDRKLHMWFNEHQKEQQCVHKTDLNCQKTEEECNCCFSPSKRLSASMPRASEAAQSRDHIGHSPKGKQKPRHMGHQACPFCVELCPMSITSRLGRLRCLPIVARALEARAIQQRKSR